MVTYRRESSQRKEYTRAESWMLCKRQIKESPGFPITLPGFLVIFLTTAFVSFTKTVIFQPTGYVFDYESVIFENTSLFHVWGTFIDPNLCWKSKFGSVNLNLSLCQNYTFSIKTIISPNLPKWISAVWQRCNFKN